MNIKCNRRTMVRIISFGMAGALAVGGCFLKMHSRFHRLERELVHRYQSSLEELSASMDSLAMTLVKSLYTGTPAAFSNLTNELVLQAGNAEAALSALPVAQQSVSTVAKFLSQVSDYSLTLTKRVINGGSITEEERSSLTKLAKVATDLSKRLEEARLLYNDSKNWEASISSALSGADTLDGLGASLTEAEEALGDYPTLIYDGPFSDHILSQTSKLLANAKEIQIDQAKMLAAAAMQVEETMLTHTGTEEGHMPSYVFTTENGSVSVTKSGGYITYFRKDREISESQMSYEDAVSTAKTYLAGRDLGAFRETYYFTDEGICVVNFAALAGEVICYPDLIKVGVALDTGEILFYEARGYLMNHTERTPATPKHTAAEAKAVISPHLTVKTVDLAIIPSGGNAERYCYEFHCTGEQDEELLIYINTETLTEEQILILLKTDGGTLTK